jgi:hypothetical protein
MINNGARGLTGGVFLTTRLAEELSFQAEAMYVRKGAAISFTHGSMRRSGPWLSSTTSTSRAYRLSGTALHGCGGL